MSTEFNNLYDFFEAFPDEEACLKHFAHLRWGDNVISPFDRLSKVYTCKRGYKCKNTGKYFNAKTGTIFEHTRIPLKKWFIALYLLTSHKKGLTSRQAARDIGVTPKTAWSMLMKLRHALINDTLTENIEGDIEVDETYVGGKNKNRHRDKKVDYSRGGAGGRSLIDKSAVFGMAERGGRVMAQVVHSVDSNALLPIIYNDVKEGSTIHSDEWKAYKKLDKSLYGHESTKHKVGNYVNGNSHTNNIECFWSHLKRGIIGTYHQVSKKHLNTYVQEYCFRYNTRDLREQDRFNFALANADKRITYKQLIKN